MLSVSKITPISTSKPFISFKLPSFFDNNWKWLFCTWKMVHCIVRNVKKECWIKSLCFLLNSNISHISKLFSWNQSTDYNWFHGSFCWWILQFHKSGSISKHIFWNKRNVTRRNQNRKVDERWRKNKSNIYQKEPLQTQMTS